MPFVLKHSQTSQIQTDTLINSYDLPYYGTKYWDQEEVAVREYAKYLQSQGLNEPSLWEVVEVDEHQMKMFNVKLKNDPKLQLYLNDQDKPFVKAANTL